MNPMAGADLQRDLGLFGTCPLPTVLLRHDLPDKTWHVDWMLARDSQAKEALITFRLDRPLFELARGMHLEAKRIADHRPAYLDYQGPVSGNRGTVSRLGEGRITSVILGAAAFCGRSTGNDELQLEIIWNLSDRQLMQQLRLIRRGSQLWDVICDTIECATIANGSQ
jgi:hypothetical protein